MTPSKPKILIASDHGGFALKQEIVRHLQENNYSMQDLGCHSDESVNYPEYARQVAQGISSGKAERGILVCGTGIGMALTANKFKGVRASIVNDIYSARMTREHNDLNVLCLGGRVIGSGLALEIVRAFLDTAFAGGRHQGRVDMIRKAEEENFK